ncbi:MAG TPA: nucleotidyl transferase AbiEii/AbiGii toxin family protein, partial [Longimicrobium sp.]|nr:nucleotidyl transferase AbiEii/AbiGii toxin family protein [Longimicrobium sp.]
MARVRRLISFMALAGALRQALRGDDAGPRFVIKGGVALELRLRDRARATRDLDVILNRDEGDPLDALEEALATEYEGFTFRRKGEEYRMPNGAVRVKVQVSFQGREWGTVEVDVANREGETEVELVPGFPLLEDFGITGPEEVECLSLRHHVAQKLHAVTRPMPDGRANDRFRDLVDLLLLRQFVQDHAAVAAACAEVFGRRGTHPWPPALQPPDDWREPFARMAGETGLPIREIDAAVAEIS